MEQKTEVTDKFIKIPNPKFKGECEEVRTINLSETQGISALFCVKEKAIKTYIFDAKKWELKDAKAWVKDHAKSASFSHVNAYLEKEDKRMLAVASEESEDRHGEVISIDGWDLKAFKKNPVLLWYHNQSNRTLPIGKADKIGFKDVNGKKKLVFEPIFEEITDEGRTIKKFYEEGWLNTFSVGFLPYEMEGNKFLKQELLEISAVPVPALASAEIIQRAKAVGVSNEKITEYFGDNIKNIEKEEDKEGVKEEETNQEVEEPKTLEEKFIKLITDKTKDIKEEELKDIFKEIKESAKEESEKEFIGMVKDLRQEIRNSRKPSKSILLRDSTLKEALKRLNQITSLALQKVNAVSKIKEV